MIPLVYVMVTVFLVQRAAFAVTEAAREAGRAFVTADDVAQGEERAGYAADLALADHGLDGPAPQIDCSDPECLTPGATVRITVSYDVPLPLLGRAFGALPGHIPVSGEYVAVVDRFRPAS